MRRAKRGGEIGEGVEEGRERESNWGGSRGHEEEEVNPHFSHRIAINLLIKVGLSRPYFKDWLASIYWRRRTRGEGVVGEGRAPYEYEWLDHFLLFWGC